MCYQPDYERQMWAFDHALLELFKEWSAMTAEHVDGASIGRQNWNAEFLRQVKDRLAKLMDNKEYKRLVRLLDAVAGAAPAMDAASGHSAPPA